MLVCISVKMNKCVYKRVSMYICENESVCISVKMNQLVCMRVSIYICENESVNVCAC